MNTISCRKIKNTILIYFVLIKADCFDVAGLDPASPLFENSPYAINKASAKFVDVIHTDARPFGNFQTFAYSEK